MAVRVAYKYYFTLIFKKIYIIPLKVKLSLRQQVSL